MSTYEVSFQDGSLGMGLSDLNEVVEMDDDGQAFHSQAIRIGDLLISVGDMEVLSLEATAEQFQTQPRPIVLRFQRRDALYVGEGSFGMGSDVLRELRDYFQSIDFLQTVEEFCLDYCDPFDNEDEMLLIYTDIFEKFQELFEDRIERFVESRGVSLEEFYGLCKESNTENEEVSAFLDMIYASFQFESFVELMRGQKEKKNRLGDPRYSGGQDGMGPPPPPPPLNGGESEEGKSEGKDGGGRRK